MDNLRSLVDRQPRNEENGQRYDDIVRSNPPVVPADTSPDVWRRQMKAIGARSVTDRMNEWAALNNAVSAMEADSVRRRRPGYTDRQVFLALVRRRYGDELAGKVWPESLAVEP